MRILQIVNESAYADIVVRLVDNSRAADNRFSAGYVLLLEHPIEDRIEGLPDILRSIVLGYGVEESVELPEDRLPVGVYADDGIIAVFAVIGPGGGTEEIDQDDGEEASVGRYTEFSPDDEGNPFPPGSTLIVSGDADDENEPN